MGTVPALECYARSLTRVLLGIKFAFRDVTELPLVAG